ncbi:MAG: hypothetical protein WB792_17510 [Desulfobacterales bacterium]|jgi:hypothetical protein
MVGKNKTLPQDIFSQFNQLDKALIDASSIIYANKAHFLKRLTSTLRLFSIHEILSEAGPVSDNIKPLAHTGKTLSNDQKLVECALHFGLPLISEDKKILMAMKSAQRPFFNSLMMLNFLLYRRMIDNRQYTQYHLALKQFARYSDEIWKYGAKIHAAIQATEPGRPRFGLDDSRLQTP